MTSEIKYTKVQERTKEIYIDQHKNFYADDTIFQRHFSHAADPESYDLTADFFVGKHVLDAGCGNSGYFQVAMHHLGAGRVTCLDIGADWQQELRKIVAKHNVPDGFIECIEGTTTNLPFPDESFDFVASNGVIMHLETVEMAKTALAELSRVARKGGVVYSHIGIDKPGIVDRYIVKSLRQAYQEDTEYRDFIDSLKPEAVVAELTDIYQTGLQHDGTLTPAIISLVSSLFTLDSTTFLQNMLQVPIQQGPRLSEEWGVSTMKEVGLTNVRRARESYWKRNDFRKYLAPIHYRLDSPTARLFYGNGHVKLVGDKR